MSLPLIMRLWNHCTRGSRKITRAQCCIWQEENSVFWTLQSSSIYEATAVMTAWTKPTSAQKRPYLSMAGGGGNYSLPTPWLRSSWSLQGEEESAFFKVLAPGKLTAPIDGHISKNMWTTQTVLAGFKRRQESKLVGRKGKINLRGVRKGYNMIKTHCMKISKH